LITGEKKLKQAQSLCMAAPMIVLESHDRYRTREYTLSPRDKTWSLHRL